MNPTTIVELEFKNLTPPYKKEQTKIFSQKKKKKKNKSRKIQS